MPLKAYGCEYVSELIQAVTGASKRTYWWQRTETITVYDHRRQRQVKARPVPVVCGEETRVFYLGREVLYRADSGEGYQLVKFTSLPPTWRKRLLYVLRRL